MKSTVCHFDGSNEALENILSETERTAAYANLGKKEALQLRLLAEELTGILRGVACDFEADFWIEEEDGTFRLNLSADTRLDREKKDKLISFSSRGENEADRGIMGKIAGIFELYMDSYDEVGTYCAESGIVLPSMQMMDSGNMMLNGDCQIWSLQNYKSNILSGHKEEWDELERSIVANLADDVTVGVRNQKVRLTVIKTF